MPKNAYCFGGLDIKVSLDLKSAISCWKLSPEDKFSFPGGKGTEGNKN